ncbi:MAG TPA: response regulator [Pseudomonas sp.]|jgi:DNA-binding response OmpR family regulator|uniref:response regulator transcription factor n=1 Tax=Pseudomonas sp. TaxID=306 RepID=UPI00260F506A|nr:response regulator [Pseudomonas sp.]HSX88986.1 response regulator [Pseudomonas sp.]
MSKSVLIVDDEPNIVVSLEFLLEQAGYQVRIAHDGQEAWEAIERQPPDLVLLDVMLPRLSGFDVCQKIREHPDLQRVRVVMLTAKGREVEVSKGLALGADAYISKPFSTQDLLAQVRTLLADA